MIDKLMAAALILGGQAQAAPEACLPRAMAGQMAVVLLPSVLATLETRCAAHVPAGSFIGAGTQAMAQRLRAETADIRPMAVAGILMLTGQPLGTGDPEVMMNTVTSGMIPELDAAKCRNAGELAESMSPLPARNLAQMSGAIVALYAGAVGEGGEAPAICPA